MTYFKIYFLFFLETAWCVGLEYLLITILAKQYAANIICNGFIFVILAIILASINVTHCLNIGILQRSI